MVAVVVAQTKSTDASHHSEIHRHYRKILLFFAGCAVIFVLGIGRGEYTSSCFDGGVSTDSFILNLRNLYSATHFNLN